MYCTSAAIRLKPHCSSPLKTWWQAWMSIFIESISKEHQIHQSWSVSGLHYVGYCRGYLHWLGYFCLRDQILPFSNDLALYSWGCCATALNVIKRINRINKINPSNRPKHATPPENIVSGIWSQPSFSNWTIAFPINKNSINKANISL